ncbi:MAG: hypothetical protein SW833_24980 [Cyanobacteriota bacterium]|nr:hypothetical protein [Cyanobacteriota bacterium]
MPAIGGARSMTFEEIQKILEQMLAVGQGLQETQIVPDGMHQITGQAN